MNDEDEITLEYYSFKDCVRLHPSLSKLRADYAAKTAEERHMAAEWEYDESFARSIFNEAIARTGAEAFGENRWPEGVIALVIDPLYAPALLTVGSIECQLEPDNYCHLNDLGWAHYEAGNFEDAVRVLERAVELSPADNELARGNLEYVQKHVP